MGEKRLALSIPIDGFTLAEHGALAREGERLGYRDAWSLEVDGVDCFSPLAVVAAATGRLRLGTAIANVYTRGPATLAMSGAGLAEAAPGRFCLGIGAGSQPIVEAWNGGKFSRPAARVRDMVLFLRRAFSGERVVFEGETFGVKGFRLSRPPAHPIPIHVAALRPRMLHVAGEVADGAVLNWLSVEDVPRAVAEVRAAAKQAGREPQAVEITARLMVSVDPPGPQTDVGLRRHINTYLNVPVYRAFHEWLGRAEVLGPMWRAWDAGDRRGAVAAVPEDVLDGLIVKGSAEEMRAHIRRYMEAGVDTAFVQLLSFEPDPERKRAVLKEAISALAPAAAAHGERPEESE
jgi:probable F420-dependent oxidoreductase